MKKDRFLKQSEVFKRLWKEYETHRSLIVALDYDNTIFDYHKKGDTYEKIIKLIKKCNLLKFKVVLFSGSAKERYPEMLEYCKSIGIKVDAINDDVVNWHPDKSLDWSRSKIYYNIFLDDRAGLKSAYKSLKQVVNEIRQ